MTKHQISSGYVSDKNLTNEKQIGIAWLVDSGPKVYYRIHFWFLPDSCFYLTKNQDGKGYTLFSRVVHEDDDEPIFQCPLGYAYTNGDVKEFIQLQLNFPWHKCFISVHPSN